jgi:CRP-like cAMP-binding protein
MYSSRRTLFGKSDDAQKDDDAPTASRSFLIPHHNLVIGSLPRIDAQRIIDAAKPIHLTSVDAVYEGGDEIEYIYFPIDCVVCSLGLLEDGSSVEISMTGREGLIGLPALIGGGHALHWTRTSVEGSALRIPTSVLQELFRNSEAVNAAIMRAYRRLFTQICQRSVCNVRHSLLQRLCVWLLMMQDRTGSKDLPFTQEEIANRISVRRAGISVAASMLQGMNVINYHRGKIVINDRALLEDTACECYRILAQDFDEDRGGGALHRPFVI